MYTCPICKDEFSIHSDFLNHKCQPAKPILKSKNIVTSSANVRFNVENLQASIYNIKMSSEILEDSEILEIQEELENSTRALISLLNNKYIWK